MAGLERKNGWTLAERADEVSPDGMQRLLRRADWDADRGGDDVRDYVVERLGDPAGVLIVDDTGFLFTSISSSLPAPHIAALRNGLLPRPHAV